MPNPLTPNTYPVPLPNPLSPVGAVMLDPTTGAMGGADFTNYTAISTAGTSTITTGRSTAGGVVFGGIFTATGTIWTAAMYDLVGTSTVNLSGTYTASAVGQAITIAPAGVGVRFLGTLIVVTTGTPGALNALWD